MKRNVFLIMFTLVFLFGATMVSGINEEVVKAKLKTLNDLLAASGKNFQIEKVDLLTHENAGTTVYANDRSHRLNSHWAPFDPWRFGTSEIYWVSENVDKTNDVPWSDVRAAVGRAMNIWNNVPCAEIPLVELNSGNLDLGYVQYLVGMGGVPGWLADITHAGWLPWVFFETIGGPGGGDGILGVTFTFTWNARPADVAFREIYYNDNFDWKVDERFFDIETVAAHEVGHALSLGHFGKIFRSANGKLHFSPRALMNAIYYDILQGLLGTDIASFCSIWASWPNK